MIGLLNQTLHHRRKVSKNETQAQKRDHPDRESRLWMTGCQASGIAPAGCMWIDICDRGGDTFEFLSYEHAHDRNYVIRSARDRKLAGDDHIGNDCIHHHLHAYARDLPELGRRTIEVSPQAGQRKARQASVRVAAGPVTLEPQPGTRGEHDGAAINTWVVHVKEIDPPAGVQPLEWILLSNLPAQTFGQACQRIDFYACRPIIEDYHKGMKTGMGIEHLQFEHADRLEPAIALLSVITALLLQLRHAARQKDADLTLARTIFPLLWVRVLAGKLHGRPRDDLSVREFLFGVARLGGHLGRKHDGPPGWLTLWRGWNDLQLMIQGARAVRGAG